MASAMEDWEAFVRKSSRKRILELITSLNNLYFKIQYKGRTTKLQEQIISLGRDEPMVVETICKYMSESLEPDVEGDDDNGEESEPGPEEEHLEGDEEEEERERGESPGLNVSPESHVRKVEVQFEGSTAQVSDFVLSHVQLSDLIRETTVKTMKSINFNGNNRTVKPKLNEFYKYCKLCNISYSGKPEEKLKRFLNDVNQALDDFDIREPERVSAFRGVLQGSALDWYEGFHKEARSSQALSRGLIEAFMPLDYDEELRLKILTEKMSYKSTLTDFIRDLRCKNQELMIPLSDKQLLDAVLRLMTPDYKKILATAVTNFPTLAKLTLAAKKADTIEAQSKKVNVTPSWSNKNRVAEMDMEEVEAINVSKGACFHCGGLDHFKVNCPYLRKKSSTDTNKPPQPQSQQPSEELIDRIVAAVLEKLKTENSKA